MQENNKPFKEVAGISSEENKLFREFAFQDTKDYFQKFVKLQETCSDSCKKLEKVEPRNLTLPKSICGSLMDVDYLSVSRPKDTDAKICKRDPIFCYQVKSGDICPKGESVCPGKIGHDNLICVKDGTSCPITSLSFAKKGSL